MISESVQKKYGAEGREFAKGRNPGKNFIGFLGDLKTPKEHFEINWPLVIFWGAISTIDNFIQETCLELHHNISHHQMQNPHELVKKEEEKMKNTQDDMNLA